MSRIAVFVALAALVVFGRPATGGPADDARQLAERLAGGPGPIVYTRDSKHGGTPGCYTLGNAIAMDEARKKWTRKQFTSQLNMEVFRGTCNEYVKRVRMIVLDRYPNRKLIKVKPEDGSGRELWVFEDMVERK